MGEGVRTFRQSDSQGRLSLSLLRRLLLVSSRDAWDGYAGGLDVSFKNDLTALVGSVFFLASIYSSAKFIWIA